jgi:DNA-binding MarR family transcriptional regulator
MRYPKDSIQLNPSRDLPLLRQILRSEFLTHSQLFEFMRLEHYERNRKSFDWRLRRLAGRGLVVRHAPLADRGEVVYSITSSGAELLQSMGENCLFGHERSNGKHAERSVLHAIGLNDIHLSALRAGVLVRWTAASEIRSQNELTEFGFAKDYDAIITVATGLGEYRFALEYERSPKTIDRYRAIAASLSMEARVSQVLYLVTSNDLLRFISGFFGNAQCRVYFGLATDWHAQLLDMPVTSRLSVTPQRFRETLDYPAARPNPAVITP